MANGKAMGAISIEVSKAVMLLIYLKSSLIHACSNYV
jgi:hypothetical protein